MVAFLVLKLCIFLNTKMLYMVDAFFCKICILITGNQNYLQFSHTNPDHVKIMLAPSGLDISCLISSLNSVGFNKINFCFSSSF